MLFTLVRFKQILRVVLFTLVRFKQNLVGLSLYSLHSFLGCCLTLSASVLVFVCVMCERARF